MNCPICDPDNYTRDKAYFCKPHQEPTMKSDESSFKLIERLGLHIWKDPCASVWVVNAPELEALLQAGQTNNPTAILLQLDLKPAKCEHEPADCGMNNYKRCTHCNVKMFKKETWEAVND